MKLQHSTLSRFTFEEDCGGCAGQTIFCATFADDATDEELLKHRYNEMPVVYEILHERHELTSVAYLECDEEIEQLIIDAFYETVDDSDEFWYALEDEEDEESDVVGIKQIDKYCERSGDVVYTLSELLCGECENIVDAISNEFSWKMQEIRGIAAKKMGKLGVIDRDDQGEVVIINTSDADDMNKRLRFVGEVSSK